MMMNDSGFDKLKAVDVARGVCRLLDAMGYACLTEFSVGNGRRADVAGLDDKGKLLLVEIKVSVADFNSDRKWPEYLSYCDLFYFAVPEDFPRHLVEAEAIKPAYNGLIIASRFEAAVIRTAQARPLSPARRKAETLRFARRSAQRLWREKSINLI